MNPWQFWAETFMITIYLQIILCHELYNNTDPNLRGMQLYNEHFGCHRLLFSFPTIIYHNIKLLLIKACLGDFYLRKVALL